MEKDQTRLYHRRYATVKRPLFCHGHPAMWGERNDKQRISQERVGCSLLRHRFIKRMPVLPRPNTHSRLLPDLLVLLNNLNCKRGWDTEFFNFIAPFPRQMKKTLPCGRPFSSLFQKLITEVAFFVHHSHTKRKKKLPCVICSP